MNRQDLRQNELVQWINQQPGYHCSDLKMVSGDASFRRYYRFDHEDSTIVAVDAPPEFEDSRKFMHVANRYLQQHVPVPHIIMANHNLGFYCLTDFGDDQFASHLNEQSCKDLYQLALSHLPAIQQCTKTDAGNLPLYDDELLDKEFHLFTHWLLNVHLGIYLSQDEQKIVESTFQFLREVFLSQPQVGVHRDFHSRNLMLLENNQLGIIDFQDAVVGPITYDAVSLLRDCYQSWPDEVVVEILHAYYLQYHSDYQWTDFKRWFDLTGMQRHIKASGIFARLCHRDGKHAYLQDVPRTLQYLINVGQNYEQCADFARLVATKIKPAMESSLS